VINKEGGLRRKRGRRRKRRKRTKRKRRTREKKRREKSFDEIKVVICCTPCNFFCQRGNFSNLILCFFLY
jgi:hypothetical protein